MGPSGSCPCMALVALHCASDGVVVVAGAGAGGSTNNTAGGADGRSARPRTGSVSFRSTADRVEPGFRSPSLVRHLADCLRSKLTFVWTMFGKNKKGKPSHRPPRGPGHQNKALLLLFIFFQLQPSLAVASLS